MLYKSVCVVCSKIFKSKSIHKDTCSRVCSTIKKRINSKSKNVKENECPECLMNFKTAKTNKIFCSKACKIKHSNKRVRDRVRHKECVYCRRQFTTKKNKQKYCSLECTCNDYARKKNAEK